MNLEWVDNNLAPRSSGFLRLTSFNKDTYLPPFGRFNFLFEAGSRNKHVPLDVEDNEEVSTVSVAITLIRNDVDDGAGLSFSYD